MSRLLAAASGYLAPRGAEAPNLDAELLLARVLGCSRLDLLLRHDMPVGEEARSAFRELVRRRGAGEPAAYILGGKEFYGLNIRVDPRCLVPRPETEHLVDATLEVLRRVDAERPRVVEVGVGSGCVLAALAKGFPAARYAGVEISPEALEVARENIGRLAPGADVDLRAGSCLEPVRDLAPLDVVVANPPYVSEGEMAALPRTVRDHEPRVALCAGPDPLALHRRILQEAWELLAPEAWVLLELPERGAEALTAFCCERLGAGAGLRVGPDLAGIPRVFTLHRRREGARGAGG